MKDFIAIARQYIEDVLSGRIITCSYTRAACQRQLDDLARTDSEWFFDEEAAITPCQFLECLTHVSGPKGGENFSLEPWECFIVTTLFGWRSKLTGQRRFSRSIIFCGKGNGKSFISSGLSLYMLCADDEQGAQVYAAARNREQAQIVFDVAYQQCLANEELTVTFGLKPFKRGITHGASGSVMKSVSAQGKSLAGLLPYFVTADESWAHRDRTVIDEMRRGCAKRPNSLMSSISHCGSDLGSVGYEQWLEAAAILTRELVDERTFCVIWSGCDHEWRSREARIAANPNLGVSVSEAELEAAAALAEKLPSQAAVYKSHNLCQWVHADERWLSADHLAACRVPNLKIEDFRLWRAGEHKDADPESLRPFAIGLDLASNQDLAAFVLLWLGFVEGAEHWYAQGRYYCPQKTVEASPNARIRGWAERGLLTSHVGSVNDFAAIEADILALQRRNHGFGVVENENGLKIVLGGVDRWQAEQMRQNLERADIELIPVAMNAPTLTQPMRWLQSLVLTNRLHFSASDEVLMWAFSNVVCHEDKNSNIFPNKSGPDNKIDPVVALILAAKAAMANGGSMMKPQAQDSKVLFINEDDTATLTSVAGVQKLPKLEEQKPEVNR